MAEWDANRIKREAYFKMMAKMNADQEESKTGMMACLEKMETRIETGQEQSNTEIETDREEVEATDVEENPVDMDAVVEQQKIRNEEAAVHSIRAWQKEMVACVWKARSQPQRTWNPKRNMKKRWMPGWQK
jgi:hypothetical protein